MPSVHFRDVEVIELPIVPGADHPMNSSSFRADSAAITVDWEAQSRTTVDLDTFEHSRKKKKSSRIGGLTSRLPRAVRKRILRKQGFETSDTEDDYDAKRQESRSRPSKVKKKNSKKKTRRKKLFRSLSSSSLSSSTSFSRQDHTSSAPSKRSTPAEEFLQSYYPDYNTSPSASPCAPVRKRSPMPEFSHSPSFDGSSSSADSKYRMKEGSSEGSTGSQEFYEDANTITTRLSPSRPKRKPSWTRRTKTAIKRIVGGSSTNSSSDVGASETELRLPDLGSSRRTPQSFSAPLPAPSFSVALPTPSFSLPFDDFNRIETTSIDAESSFEDAHIWRAAEGARIEEQRQYLCEDDLDDVIEKVRRQEQQDRSGLKQVLGVLAKKPVRLAKSTPKAIGSLAMRPVKLAKSTHRMLKSRGRRRKAQNREDYAENGDEEFANDDGTATPESSCALTTTATGEVVALEVPNVSDYEQPSQISTNNFSSWPAVETSENEGDNTIQDLVCRSKANTPPQEAVNILNIALEPLQLKAALDQSLRSNGDADIETNDYLQLTPDGTPIIKRRGLLSLGPNDADVLRGSNFQMLPTLSLWTEDHTLVPLNDCVSGSEQNALDVSIKSAPPSLRIGGDSEPARQQAKARVEISSSSCHIRRPRRRRRRRRKIDVPIVSSGSASDDNTAVNFDEYEVSLAPEATVESSLSSRFYGRNGQGSFEYDSLDGATSLSSADSGISAANGDTSFMRFDGPSSSVTACMMSPPSLPSRYRGIQYMNASSDKEEQTASGSRRPSLPSRFEAIKDIHLIANSSPRTRRAYFERSPSTTPMTTPPASCASPDGNQSIEHKKEMDTFAASIRSLPEFKGAALLSPQNMTTRYASMSMAGDISVLLENEESGEDELSAEDKSLAGGICSFMVPPSMPTRHDSIDALDDTDDSSIGDHSMQSKSSSSSSTDDSSSYESLAEMSAAFIPTKNDSVGSINSLSLCDDVTMHSEMDEKSLTPQELSSMAPTLASTQHDSIDSLGGLSIPGCDGIEIVTPVQDTFSSPRRAGMESVGSPMPPPLPPTRKDSIDSYGSSTTRSSTCSCIGTPLSSVSIVPDDLLESTARDGSYHGSHRSLSRRVAWTGMVEVVDVSKEA